MPVIGNHKDESNKIHYTRKIYYPASHPMPMIKDLPDKKKNKCWIKWDSKILKPAPEIDDIQIPAQ